MPDRVGIQGGAAPAPPPAPGQVFYERDSEDNMLMVADEAAPAERMLASAKVRSSPKRGSLSRQEPREQIKKKPSPQRAKRQKASPAMVVYSGYLSLRVRRMLETVDSITAWIEAKGGYIQSLTKQVIVVRVPSEHFEAAMEEFSGLGEVLNHSINSVDVSARYTDLSARLAVSKQARERLLVLLEQVKEVQQRLRILQEIKRLSEQIETIESTLNTLRQLADFSTITVQLQPVVQGSRARQHRSPFQWIRNLQAHYASLKEGKGDFSLKLPKGFVLFEDDDLFRARAADTSTLRGAKLKNDPKGDGSFWARAIQHEMSGRDEESLKEGESAGLIWRVYRSKDLRPRYYLLAVQTQGEQLFLIEAHFPNETAWTERGDAVIQSLSSFKIK